MCIVVYACRSNCNFQAKCIYALHEQTTKELVYTFRRGLTCISVHPFDVWTCEIAYSGSRLGWPTPKIADMSTQFDDIRIMTQTCFLVGILLWPGWCSSPWILQVLQGILWWGAWARWETDEVPEPERRSHCAPGHQGNCASYTTLFPVYFIHST